MTWFLERAWKHRSLVGKQTVLILPIILKSGIFFLLFNLLSKYICSVSDLTMLRVYTLLSPLRNRLVRTSLELGCGMLRLDTCGCVRFEGEKLEPSYSFLNSLRPRFSSAPLTKFSI